MLHLLARGLQLLPGGLQELPGGHSRGAAWAWHRLPRQSRLHHAHGGRNRRGQWAFGAHRAHGAHWRPRRNQGTWAPGDHGRARRSPHHASGRHGKAAGRGIRRLSKEISRCVVAGGGSSTHNEALVWGWQRPSCHPWWHARRSVGAASGAGQRGWRLHHHHLLRTPTYLSGKRREA